MITGLKGESLVVSCEYACIFVFWCSIELEVGYGLSNRLHTRIGHFEQEGELAG